MSGRSSKRRGWLVLMLVAVQLAPPLPAGAWDGVAEWARPTTVQKLAKGIDRLERHIEEYGTIVTKQPDVWGESRLMQHRQDVEGELKKELDEFRFRLNGAINQTDAAFLSESVALARGSGTTTSEVEKSETKPDADGKPVTTTTKTTEKKTTPTPAQLTAATPEPGTASATPLASAGSNSFALEPTIHVDQLNRYLQHLNHIRRLNEGDDTSDSPGYAMHLVRFPISILPGKKTRAGYGAEITLSAKPYLTEELLPQTFRNLVINDTVQRLGLSVTRAATAKNVARLRNSLKNYYFMSRTLAPQRLRIKELQDRNPDRARQIRVPYYDNEELFGFAYAAELTFKPAELQDEIKKAIATILLQELAFAQTVDPNFDASVTIAARSGEQRSQPRAVQLAQFSSDNQIPPPVPSLQDAEGTSDSGLDSVRILNKASLILKSINRQQRANLEMVTPPGVADEVLRLMDEKLRSKFENELTSPSADGSASTSTLRLPNMVCLDSQCTTSIEATPANKDDQMKAFALAGKQEAQKLTGAPLASVATRLSRQPSPATHQTGINGITLARLAVDAFDFLDGAAKDEPLHLPDVEGFLRQEADGAYEFLSRPGTMGLWDEFCTSDLVEAVREGRRLIDDRDEYEYLRSLRNNPLGVKERSRLPRLRRAFFDAIRDRYPELKDSSTASLAWALLVDSALLNDQLGTDMRESAVAKGCPCLNQGWMPFYGPNPPAEARAAFVQYVECRWPIQVFALDPSTQDQNILQTFQRRREMQLVLALALSRGKTNLQSVTRFRRQLDMDLATIDLNRTDLGFSHANDTFGWRFTPRVQPPRIRGNLAVATMDLLHGGPTGDQDLLDRKLEPGIRECTAIVLMPSFVPYATFDTRVNWYKLTNPQKKLLDMNDSLELSKQITDLHQLSTRCAADAHRYRGGDINRMLISIEQLDRRLPLQTAQVALPFENTLGGFKMFSRGVTDLGPELHGYYGETFANVGGAADAKGTTVYLVGNHFSVLDSRVVAGGRNVTDSRKIISRQICEITIPSDAMTIEQKDLDGVTRKFVDVHLATPYGVSNHLLIRAVTPAETQKDLIGEAVKKHEAALHLDRFAWSELPSAIIVATRNGAGVVMQVDIEDYPSNAPLVLTASSESGFTNEQAEYQIACRANYLDKDGKSLDKRVLGPVASTDSQGLVGLDAIVQATARKGWPTDKSKDVTHVRLECFVRAVDGEHRPTMPVENHIVLPVKFLECQTICRPPGVIAEPMSTTHQHYDQGEPTAVEP